MGQTVGTWFTKNLTIMANAVGSESGLGLNGRGISHPALPWSALAVASNRSVDQARVARRKSMIVQPEEAKCSSPKVLDDDVSRIAEAKRQLAGAGHVEVDADIAL